MLLEWPKVIPPKGARKSRPERPPGIGPDAKWPGIYRVRLPGGGLSDTADLGSASVDDRRQAATQGISKRGNNTCASAADPWSTSGTLLCCGKGHRTSIPGHCYREP